VSLAEGLQRFLEASGASLDPPLPSRLSPEAREMLGMAEAKRWASVCEWALLAGERQPPEEEAG
jgi:hypothetical protein